MIADMDRPEYFRLRAIEIATNAKSEKEVHQAIGLLALHIASGALNETTED